MRILPPLPRTIISALPWCTSPSSRSTSSWLRRPQPYSSSKMARSRSCLGLAAGGRLQHGHDFVQAQRARQSPAPARARQQPRRVGAQHAALRQVPAQGAQRGELAGQCRRRIAAAAQIGRERAHRRTIQRRQRRRRARRATPTSWPRSEAYERRVATVMPRTASTRRNASTCASGSTTRRCAATSIAWSVASWSPSVAPTLGPGRPHVRQPRGGVLHPRAADAAVSRGGGGSGRPARRTPGPRARGC